MLETGDAPPGAEAGFTLIETLTVVGVAALVSALLFPSLVRTLDGMTLLRVQASVGADLRAARARAIRLGRPVLVAIDSDGADYVVDGQPRVLPVRVRLTPRGRIAFFPDGSSVGGLIRIAADGRERSLSVDAVTGLTQIMPPRFAASGPRP